MRIAISARGTTLDSEVDPRFGRAKCFLIFDTDTGESQVIDNEQNLQLSQGAGIQAAQQVSRMGAGVLLTGHCGPKAYQTLAAAGIRVITGADGTVSQVIQRFQAGALDAAEGPDVDGHW